MFKRELNIFNTLDSGNSILLLGPRGVGKSRLGEEVYLKFPSAIKYNLLERSVYMNLSSNPSLFLSQVRAKISANTANLPTLIFIDEVQKLPELLDEVHLLLEENPKKVCFLLSGSSARKLRNTGVNLLAGRAFTKYLHPLSFNEVSLQTEQVLQFGSLPRVINEPNLAIDFLNTYVDTYLREEIFQEALVRRMNSFARFLEIAGQFNGEFPNFSRIGKASGIAGNTVREYFSILEDTLIVTRIDHFSFSTMTQIRMAPKYYFFDCGVLNAVRNELLLPIRPSTLRYGKLFETMVVNQIVTTNNYTESRYKLYHWHTHDGQEVDLILARGTSEPPIAIEIKSTATPEISDLKGLKAFVASHENARPLLLCQTQEEFAMEGIPVLPWREGIKRIFFS